MDIVHLDWTQVIVAMLSLLAGGSMTQLFRLRSERTKILSEAKLADAQTASVISEAAARQIQTMEQYASKRIAELESTIARMQAQYEGKIAALMEQVAELHGEIAHLRKDRHNGF